MRAIEEEPSQKERRAELVSQDKESPLSGSLDFSVSKVKVINVLFESW